VLAAAHCEIDDRDTAIARIAHANGLVKGIGIRQGMPLSPILSNIILRFFDEAMIKKGHHLTRYADDFLVLADSERQCREIDDFARSVLHRLGFELPPLGAEDSKTCIVDPDTEIEFLGLALAATPGGGYQLIITARQLEKIRRALGQLKDVDQLVDRGIDITKLSRLIDNKIGGYIAAYEVACNSRVLQLTLESMRGEILRSIFGSAFGDDKVQALSSRHKRFLCLEGPLPALPHKPKFEATSRRGV
jgi:RNA-directed DNA polymerase